MLKMPGGEQSGELMRICSSLSLTVLFVALASGFTAGCATDGERDLPVSLELPLVGTRISEAYAVGAKKVPLPPGDWTVIGTQIEKDGARGFHTTSMLAQIKNNQLQAAVEIAINLPIPKSTGNGKPKSDAGEGWPTHQGCLREDIHFLKVAANVRLGEQDCWWVNHWRMHRIGLAASEHWKKSVKYLTDNKIFAPLDMIGVTYRLADKEHYLTVTYFVNPGFSNFESKNDVNWSIAAWETSVWHPDQVKKDPKKSKYINDIIAWGKSWHPKVKSVSQIGVIK